MRCRGARPASGGRPLATSNSGEAEPMAKAYLMVRALLDEAADRPRFDRWYETEHLPDAVARFGARRGWRCWSRMDPTVNYAFYEFSDVTRAQAVLGSP